MSKYRVFKCGNLIQVIVVENKFKVMQEACKLVSKRERPLIRIQPV